MIINRVRMSRQPEVYILDKYMGDISMEDREARGIVNEDIIVVAETQGSDRRATVVVHNGQVLSKVNMLWIEWDTQQDFDEIPVMFMGNEYHSMYGGSDAVLYDDKSGFIHAVPHSDEVLSAIEEQCGKLVADTLLSLDFSEYVEVDNV